jgi:hypothetical protein
MAQSDYEKIFSGEWILLFNDKIVDHSDNLEDMLKLAEEKYPDDKFPNDSIRITKVYSGSPREILLNK